MCINLLINGSKIICLILFLSFSCFIIIVNICKYCWFPRAFKWYVTTIIISIDPDFPKNHKVIGKSKHEDNRFHFVWEPGRDEAESSSNEQIQAAYKSRGEEYVPLGIQLILLIILLMLEQETISFPVWLYHVLNSSYKSWYISYVLMLFKKFFIM